MAKGEDDGAIVRELVPKGVTEELVNKHGEVTSNKVDHQALDGKNCFLIFILLCLLVLVASFFTVSVSVVVIVVVVAVVSFLLLMLVVHDGGGDDVI